MFSTKKFSKNFKAIQQLFPYMWPKDWHIRVRFLLAIFLLLTTIGLNLSVPLILRKVINTISIKAPSLFFAELLFILYGAVWTLSKIIDQLRFIIMNRVVERGIRLVSLDIFEHLISLSPRFHSEKKTGSIMSAFYRAQSVFSSLTWGLFFIVIPTLIEVIIATAILIYLYGYLYGFILASILIAFMIFSTVGSTWSASVLRIANEKSSQVSAKIFDSLMNYETINYFGSQRYESRRCDQLLSEKEEAATKQQSCTEIVLLGQGIIMGIGLIALTWLSGVKVIAGTLHISDFILINGYLLQFMIPLGNFGYILRDLNQNLTHIEEVVNILNEKSDIQDAPNAPPLILKTGFIKFEDVSFYYDQRRPILDRISFDIPAKNTIAIVGATGSGKSTLVKLLFRNYDVLNGRILIDNQDIREVSRSSLHAAIAFVSQHTALFNDTLGYNIAYGNPNASDEEIKKAIEDAHLTSFITSLPEGLNTIVGEQGLKLSGGERQRVAIARVLLKKSPIYVFDEATSSLDTKTEYLIQQNIEEISRNTTVFIIAHRLSTVVHADKILVLDQGKIVEEGTHEVLLQQNGLYAQLWSKQMKHKSDFKLSDILNTSKSMTIN